MQRVPCWSVCLLKGNINLKMSASGHRTVVNNFTFTVNLNAIRSELQLERNHGVIGIIDV